MQHLLIFTLCFVLGTGWEQVKSIVTSKPDSTRSKSISPQKKASAITNKSRQAKVHNPYIWIKSISVGYVSDQLNLTSEEKDKFLPVYNQYLDELIDTKRQKNQNIKLPASRDQLEKDLMFDQKIVDIRKHYAQEFLKCLPPQKVALIFKSERTVRAEVYNQLKERRATAGN